MARIVVDAIDGESAKILAYMFEDLVSFGGT